MHGLLFAKIGQPLNLAKRWPLSATVYYSVHHVYWQSISEYTAVGLISLTGWGNNNLSEMVVVVWALKASQNDMDERV